MNPHPPVPAPPGTTVEVRVDEGDLTIYGWDRNELTARGASARPSVGEHPGRVVIHCRGSLEIHTPRHVALEVTRVGGHATLRGIDGFTHVLAVGAGLTLEDVAGTAVDAVGGDLDAREVRAALHVRSVGGDIAVDRIGGPCRLDHVGGHLAAVAVAAELGASVGGTAILFAVSRPIDVTAGGDIRAELDPRAQGTYRLTAGGDLSVSFFEASNAEVRLAAAGDMQVLGPTVREARGRGMRLFTLGQGGPEVHLSAGGDASVYARGTAAPVTAGAMSQEASGHDDRATVLHLLEIGRIDVGQAEALLAALASDRGPNDAYA